MDSAYEHILIDESQDTNIKQWQIINQLCDDFSEILQHKIIDQFLL